MRRRRRLPPARRAPAARFEESGSRVAGLAAVPGGWLVWIVLALLVAARAALGLVPGMWGWSLNLQRFLVPALGWSLWSAMALSLLPPLARRAAPVLARAGDAAVGHPTATALAWAAALAMLVWIAPDRVRYVGDFILRQGTIEMADQPALLFPQALPLDLLLHHRIPLTIAQSGLAGVEIATRLLGAAEAALLGMLAMAFARTLSLRGIAAFACASVVAFGGYLGLFTGYSKALSESCLLTAATAVFAIEMVRRDRGQLPLGITLAIGVALHRSMLGLLPVAVLAWVLWARAHGGGGAWRRPRVVLALAVPIAALALLLPRVVALVLSFDTDHFAPPEVRHQGGVLRAVLAGNRPLDLLNLIVLLSPLALAAPILAGSLLRARPALPEPRRRPGGLLPEALLLGVLALPFLVAMLFIRPAQGLFRDWDVSAAAGVAVSLLTAWLVGRALERAGRAAWLGVAVTVGAMAPSLQWLALHTDVDRGLARARAFLFEPPLRTPLERGRTWNYIGIRHVRLAGERPGWDAPGDERTTADHWAAADEALGHAAETIPSPRVLREWALARLMRRDLRGARQIYRLMVARDSASVPGWAGIASVSADLGDPDEAKRAAARALRLSPADPSLLRLFERIAPGEPAPPPRP